MTRPISCYDPARFDSVLHGYTLEQRKAGGRTRARTGLKHPVYKIYVRDTVSLPEDYVHGRAGGQARTKAPRDKNGRFTK